MGNKNFTRKDLSIKIHKNIGFSKSLCLKIIDDFFENITHEIIKLNKTKIEAKIVARKVVKFKPSLILKKKINNNG